MKRFIRCAMLADFINSDTIHRIMHDPNFGDFTDYQLEEGNIVRTNETPEYFAGAPGRIKSRYWKFVKLDDSTWNVTEVDEYGAKLFDGKEFEVSEK